MPEPTIHASAVLLGHCGILIRGASGAGKSRLALAILQAAGTRFARLIGDDRIHAQAAHGRLLLRPAAALQGFLEVRGLGIQQLPFEPVAVADVVVDLGIAEALRLPAPADLATTIEGVTLARLAVAPDAEALPALLQFLQRGKAGVLPARPVKPC